MDAPASLSAAPAPVRADAPSPPAQPELIHPQLWRADQLGSSRQETVSSGMSALDQELPGGGWPRRSLTELLLRQPGAGEMRLLAPTLAAVARGDEDRAVAGRSVMLFDPPAIPCAWAMTQLGLDARALVVVHGREGPRGASVRHLLVSADLLWALEQALRSGHVGAIVAWLPDGLRADAVRRLQLAAQTHDGPVFLMRGIEMRLRPSPAPLRLSLHAAGPEAIDVQILKRRGPPLAQMLRLSLPAPQGLRRAPSVVPASARSAEFSDVLI